MTLRVAIAIDVEPRPRLPTRADDSDWDGFRASLELVARLRRELARLQRKPPAFTWLLRMDPQVRRVYGETGWIASRFAKELDALEREGDDVGLHTHLFRWDARSDGWIIDYESSDWMRGCVEGAVAAYRSTRGARPRFHSFGDRYFSMAAVRALEDAGIDVDMSVEPGLAPVGGIFPGETLVGALPDTRRAPRRPWRPAPDDWLRADPGAASRLLLLPVTTYRFPAWMEPGRRAEHLVRGLRGRPPGLDERVQRYVRVGCTQRGYVFRHGVRSALAADGPSSMHLVLRADQALDRAARERILANLGWLLRGGAGPAAELVSTSALVEGGGIEHGGERLRVAAEA